MGGALAGGGSLLESAPSMREADKGGSAWPSLSRSSSSAGLAPEQLASVDLLYLKNVVLKFVNALVTGRTEQVAALLPAVATLLRASPSEFKALQGTVGGGAKAPGSWWTRIDA